MDKDVLNPQEVADLLSIEYKTVLDFAKRGILPGAKLGGVWRFSRQAILDYLYYGSFSKLSRLMNHVGIDVDQMVKWIHEMHSYKDKTELDLVKTAKLTVAALRRQYADQVPPDPSVIEELSIVLNKMEIFQPQKSKGETA